MNGAHEVFVVSFLNWSYERGIGTWERTREFHTEGEARRFVANINPFSDRWVVQGEVVS